MENGVSGGSIPRRRHRRERREASLADVEQTVPRCVNHPATETRLACSNCGDPICTRCMRQAAVGQKCPRCARSPRRARALGKPVHYVKAIGLGLPAAVAGGLLLNLLLQRAGFGAVILPAVLGFGIGRLVGWAAAGQSQQPFLTIAVVLAVVGAVITFGGLPSGVFGLLGIGAAGYCAARGLQTT